MTKSLRVAAVIIKGDKILLIRRNKSGEKYYVLPGGHIEGRESPEEALNRELFEETSISVDILKLLYERKVLEDDSRELYYLCRTEFDGLVLNKTSEEYAKNAKGNDEYEPVWMKISKLGSLTLYPLEIRNRIIADLHTNKFGFDTLSGRLSGPLAKPHAKPVQSQFLGKIADTVIKSFDNIIRYTLAFFGAAFIFLSVLSYFGQFSIEFNNYIPSDSPYATSELAQGTFWPTFLYITNDGQTFEIFPKSLAYDEKQNIYYAKTENAIRVYRTPSNEIKTIGNAAKKWLPILIFSGLGIVFFYLTFRPRKNPIKP